MGNYDTMQVCRKWGHVINDEFHNFPAKNQNFCNKCGSETMIECQSCKKQIRGDYVVSTVVTGEIDEAPLFCHGCGKGYPWKGKREVINFLQLLISPIKYFLDSILSLFKK